MRIALTATLAGVILLAGASIGARAAPVSGLDHLSIVTDRLAPVEPAQYVWGGRRYCFYPNGWRGPGFYWCGYAWRRGFGWGGPVGWRGWRAPYRGVGPRYGRGPVYRRGVGPRPMPRAMPRAGVRAMPRAGVRAGGRAGGRRFR